MCINNISIVNTAFSSSEVVKEFGYVEHNMVFRIKNSLHYFKLDLGIPVRLENYYFTCITDNSQLAKNVTDATINKNKMMQAQYLRM